MSKFIPHKADRQHTQALADCKLANRGLVDLFEKVLGDIKNSLVEAEEVDQIRQLQGEAKLVRDFLDSVEKSSEVLARANSS